MFKLMTDSRKTQMAIAISLLLGAIYQYISVLNIESSLALTSMDDGPVIPYLLTKRFDLFYEDSWNISWWQLRWTSASKWIPALLGYLNIEISRQLLQIFLLAFQGMFLTLGVFVLSYSIVRNRKIALLMVLFFCVTRPHFNNWAFYGDQEFMPYVTWLALGPLMVGLGLKIMNKKLLAICFVALGSSMHVSMGIVFGLAIFLLSCLQDYKVDKKIKFISNSTILIGPVAFFLIGYLSLLTININYESVSEQKSLLSNQHYRAWIINPDEKSYLLTVESLLMALLLVGIVYSISNLYNAKKLFSYNIFFKFVIAINLLFYIFQALFYSLEITKLASVSWGRISLLLILSLYVVIFDVIYKRILIKNEYSIQDRLILYVVLGTFVLGSKLSMLLCIITILFFSMLRNIKEKRISAKRLHFTKEFIYSSILLLIVIYALNLIDLRYREIVKQIINVIMNFDGIRTIVYLIHELLVDTPQSYVNLEVIRITTFYLSSLIILGFFLFTKPKFLIFVTIPIIVFIGSISFQNKIQETENRNSRYDSFKDIQIWAKNNSKVDETFVVEAGTSTYGAWGSLAERPRLITSNLEGQQYLYTQRNKSRNLERASILSEINSKGITLFSDAYYVEFHKKWNFNYIVQKNEEIKIKSFPLLYQNNDFSIFGIYNKS